MFSFAKISGILFILYVNEVVYMNKIMNNDKLYKEITGNNMKHDKKTKHSIINFVDDQTNIISNNDPEQLKIYTEELIVLLNNYYRTNKLIIYDSKSKFVILAHPEMGSKKCNMKIKTEKGETLSDDAQIKVLGFWISQNHSYETHLRKTRANIINTLRCIKPATDAMDTKQRKEIIYSKAVSQLLYGSQLLLGQTQRVKDLFESTLMICNRRIYSRGTFKMRNCLICKEIKVDEPKQIMLKQAATAIHKIISIKKPEPIFKLYKFTSKKRVASQISVHRIPKTIKGKRGFVYVSHKLYNSLPSYLRALNHKSFKKKIKSFFIQDIRID